MLNYPNTLFIETHISQWLDECTVFSGHLAEAAGSVASIFRGIFIFSHQATAEWTRHAHGCRRRRRQRNVPIMSTSHI